MAHFDGPKCQEVHQRSPASTGVGVNSGVKDRWPGLSVLTTHWLTNETPAYVSLSVRKRMPSTSAHSGART
jgi:hypothetical protein